MEEGASRAFVFPDILYNFDEPVDAGIAIFPDARRKGREDGDGVNVDCVAAVPVIGAVPKLSADC